MPSNAENLLQRIENFPNMNGLCGALNQLRRAVDLYNPPATHTSNGYRRILVPSTLGGEDYKQGQLNEARAALLPLLEELLSYQVTQG